jgi:hypothetical protein
VNWDSAVLGGVVGGAAGSVIAWLLTRWSTNTDLLRNIYVEWAAACHEVLVKVRGLAGSINSEAKRTGQTYVFEAVVYFSSPHGEGQRQELVRAAQTLELAEFKVAISDDSEEYVLAVMEVTKVATELDPMKDPPVERALAVFIGFVTGKVKKRFRIREGLFGPDV